MANKRTIVKRSKKKTTVSPKTKKKRLLGLDAIRGFAVLLMISTHVIISFFWDTDIVWLKVLSYIGGYISFSLFLVVSGFVVGYLQEKLSLKKIIKKSLVLLAIYLGIGFLFTQLSDSDTLSLFTAPVFLEEYLIPLAIFPFIGFVFLQGVKKIKLVKGILMSKYGGFLIIVLGFILTFVGKLMAPWGTNLFASIFIGSETLHTFPIISYAVIYSIGMWLGWSHKEESPKDYIIESLSMIFISILVTFGALFYERVFLDINNLDAIRWPPTLFFIASGLSISLIILTFFMYVSNEWKKWILPLPSIGKYALHLFVAHLLVIYGFQYYLVWRVPKEQRTPAPILGPVPTLLPKDQIYNLLEDPTYKTSWPFNQKKIAVVKISDALKGNTVTIEIDSSDIGINTTLAGVEIYSIDNINQTKKLQHTKLKISSNLSKLSIKVPTNSAYIAIGVPLTQKSSTVNTAGDLIQSPNDIPKTTLVTLDKKFSDWITKPYSVEGRTWYVKDPNLMKEQLQIMSLSMPITCEQISQYEELLATEITISESEKIARFDSCINTNMNDFVYNLPFSKSFSTITFQNPTDIFQKKIGVHTLSYTLTIPAPYIDSTLQVQSIKKVYVSQPVYVIWSLDWEGLYVAQSSMDKISSIRSSNPGLVITHMFNPRIWNSSSVSSYSANSQIDYVKTGYKKYSDEIALHLHMYRDLVSKSGATPLEIQGWSNRTDGYDIPTTEYSYDDLYKIFSFAVNAFEAKGLPVPISYRAGGWFADINVLKAAKANGLRIDSSGRTAYTSGSFGSGKRYVGPWNLSSLEQPYWISSSNVNTSAYSKSSGIGIYEIPNNGGDSWAFSVDSMIDRFGAIYPKETLKNRKVVTFLSHPEFMNTEGPKIEKVIQTTYMYSAEEDNGAVVYTTLKDYYDMYAK